MHHPPRLIILPHRVALSFRTRQFYLSLYRMIYFGWLMVLAIDIGNSMTKFGLFGQDNLVSRFDVDTQQTLSHSIKTQLVASPVRGCIISSVVPDKTSYYQNFVDENFGVKPLLVSAELNLGMKLIYDNPLKLGTDRIADVVGARVLYGTPVIVVDFGTATTLNVVNAHGDFVGGVIMPGMKTGLSALTANAAQLEDVPLKKPKRIVATNTIHALQSGIVYGTIEAVGGFIESIRTETRQDYTVVGTGGLAYLVAPHIPEISKIDKNLTLAGLKILYELNSHS